LRRRVRGGPMAPAVLLLDVPGVGEAEAGGRGADRTPSVDYHRGDISHWH
jgi:hypothetical protein